MNIAIKNKGYVYYSEIHFCSNSSVKVYDGKPLTEQTSPIMTYTYNADTKHLDTLNKIASPWEPDNSDVPTID